MTHCINGLKVRNHEHIEGPLLHLFSDEQVCLPRHNNTVAFESASGRMTVTPSNRTVSGICLATSPWHEVINMHKYVEKLRTLREYNVDIKQRELSDGITEYDITFSPVKIAKQTRMDPPLNNTSLIVIVNEDGLLEDFEDNPALLSAKHTPLHDQTCISQIGHYKNGLLHSPDKYTPAFQLLSKDSGSMRVQFRLFAQNGYLHSKETYAFELLLGSNKVYRQCYVEGYLHSLNKDYPGIYTKTLRFGKISVHCDMGNIANGENTITALDSYEDGSVLTASIENNMLHNTNGPALVICNNDGENLHGYYCDGVAYRSVDEYAFYCNINKKVVVSAKLTYNDKDVFF